MPLANINGQKIFFEDSAGKGPALVFMHGFLMDQSLFDSQVKELSPHYRCIRWDARCFGQTQWNGNPFTLYDSVNDCFGLMDFLEIDSAILIGMSQGGYCALRAALTTPKRVKGLVLMSTQSSIDSEILKTGYREMRDVWQQVGPVAPLLEGLATAILGPNEAPGMKAYWNIWLPKWKEYSGQAIFHAMNNLLERDEITHRLHDISCPAFVTHGTEDNAIPTAIGEELSKKLPNCKGFVVAPGAHAVNMTNPKMINQELKKFLDGL
ncbi:MAG: alpha/beta hydrolase [Candidatus Protochlamydia sp.]|nr:alpha/beta hydrolase [Candidatus Protochlamydia sp.]